MTKDPENIKDACKEKGNNAFLFIAGRTEITCRLRKEKKQVLMVRKIGPWNELPKESPPVEALRNGSATALTGRVSVQLRALKLLANFL